jgi:hypothetical protein
MGSTGASYEVEPLTGAVGRRQPHGRVESILAPISHGHLSAIATGRRRDSAQRPMRPRRDGGNDREETVAQMRPASVLHLSAEGFHRVTRM